MARRARSAGYCDYCNGGTGAYDYRDNRTGTDDRTGATDCRRDSGTGVSYYGDSNSLE